jgi:4-amino-4-deoxy-L-arabinose transferase-like glycosyltransferase
MRPGASLCYNGVMEQVTSAPPAAGRASSLSARLDAALAYVTGSHLRAVGALLIFALLCFLPGIIALPPTDRDEARFAQASRQMLESGDFIDIRFQSEARHKKPVGIYWLQVASVRTAEALGFAEARSRIVFYRIPSLLGAVGTVLLTYWAALAFVARRYAFFAALMMAGSVLLGVEARLAKTDAMLCLTAVAVMGALARTYCLAGRAVPAQPATSWRIALVFWTALAASILLKGPILVLFAALAIVALIAADRDARWLLNLKPLAGLAWLLVLVLPWYLAVTFRTEGAFLETSVGGDLLSKVLRGQEGHGAPPGYYLLSFFAAFWPAAPLALLAAPFAWHARGEPGVRFLLAWIVPAWLLFEAVVTKLPHYLLPIFPAVAILIAVALSRAVPVDRWTRRAGWLWPIFALLVLAAGIALVTAFGGRFGFLFWPAATAALILAGIAFIHLTAGDVERAILVALVAAIGTSAALATVLARTGHLFLAPRLVAAARLDGCPKPEIASAGFHEPSLVFLAGTATRLASATEAADFLRLGRCRIAFITQRDAVAFDERARETGLLYTRLAEVSGINYSNGRRLTISVLARKEGE